MNTQSIYAKTECYLSPIAERAVDQLVRECEMDRDLAISVLEQIWPDEIIYELPLE